MGDWEYMFNCISLASSKTAEFAVKPKHPNNADQVGDPSAFSGSHSISS
jgi:hypothetical protein